MIYEMAERAEEWLFDSGAPALIVFARVMGCVLVVAVLITAGICGLSNYFDGRDPHISLNKTEWRCSHSHSTLVGKVPEDICDTYRMNGYE